MIAERSRTIVLATDNPHKVMELSSLLAALSVPVEVLPRPEWLDDVDETGTTFVANADLKAIAVASAVGEWALADDSGLEVDALNAVSYTHLRAHETVLDLVCRLLLENTKQSHIYTAAARKYTTQHV